MAKNEKKFQNNESSPYETRTVDIRRVAKVVKGGRTMRFSATVVMGDKKGMVGVGMGKAAEVPSALEKAGASAKRNLTKIATLGTTIPHAVIGVFGRGRVLLMPAVPGTGVIAGATVRAVVEACGIKDIRTKAIGTTNPINCAKATLEGLKQLKTADQIALIRDKKVEDILSEEDLKAFRNAEESSVGNQAVLENN